MSRARGPKIVFYVAGVLGGFVVLLLATTGYTEATTRAVVRVTAQIGVVLFCGAFMAAPLRLLAQGRVGAWLLARRRQLGISFGVCHALHVAALAALGVSFPDPFMEDLDPVSLIGGGLVSALIFAMALTSSDAAQRAIGMRSWKRLHTVGSYAAWFAFTTSYLPRAAEDAAYLPFSLLLVGTFGLRIARISRRRLAQRRDASTASVVCLAAWLALAPGASRAGEVDVLNARVKCDAESRCRVTATLRHADVGWSHYADAFEVLDAEETVLGIRVLRHPHVHDQPFTRALDGIELPPDLETVTIRGRDNVHGNGGREVTAKVIRPGMGDPSETEAEPDDAD